MNSYKILIYNGTDFIDISSLVQTNMNIQDKLDLTLDFASFTIPQAKASYTQFPNIDFSKVIKPWTPVIIDINNGVEKYRFYTTDCTRSIIGKGTTKLYKHEINLVEATKSLFGKPIPDMTITQPKSVLFDGKYFSDSIYENLIVENTEINVPLTLLNDSNDISYLSGRTLKLGNTYQIFYSLKAVNSQYDINSIGLQKSGGDTTLSVGIYKNDNTLIDTVQSFYVPEASYTRSGFLNLVITAVPSETKYFYSFYYTPLTDNEVISIKVNTEGSYTIVQQPDSVSIIEDKITLDTYLTISTGKTDDVDYFKYIDEEAQKILDSVNSQYGTSYYLSQDTIANAHIECPEYTFQSYTAWDALERLANKINAIPEVGVSNYSEVSFLFLDDEPDLEYDTSFFTEETQAYIFDDYNAGYELNAVNTVEEDLLKNAKTEPYIGGWMTVRSDQDDVSQMTESNAAFRTRQAIYKIYSMFIKNVKVTITNDDTTKILYGNTGLVESASSYWDISDLTVETQRWNTYENGTMNANDSVRKLKNTKGNHIHYTQGKKFVFDLGYKTDTVSDFIGTTIAPRALMETIMKAAAHYIESTESLTGYRVVTATNSNPELAIVDSHNIFTGVLAQITYVPFTNLRSTLYKYNAYELGVDTVKFSNEQDKVNDTTNLGEHAKKTLNKLGNIIYTVSGRASDYVTIPKLGFKTDDGKFITSRSINLNKNLVTYDLELSENFLNQSTYVGVPSAYRQYEVPTTDIVHRQDKHQEFILLTNDKTSNLPTSSNFTQYGKRLVIDCISVNTSLYNQYPISFSKMTITKTQGSVETDNVVSIESPINGYAIGNTINLQLEMEDNYSAAPRLDNDIITIGTDPYKLQNYAGYTNFLGSFYSYDLELRSRGTLLNNETDANEYPFTYSNTFGTYDVSLFNLTKLNVRKDAREKYGLNIQLPVLSTNNSTLRVYPGFAKYNALIRNKTNRGLGFALITSKNYFPGINDQILDTSKVSIITSGNFATVPTYDSTNLVYGVNVYSNVLAYQHVYGYVLYQLETNELILAAKQEFDNDSSTAVTMHQFNTLWFIHKKTLNTRMYPDNPVTYTVTFAENGGTDIQNQTVIANNRCTEPTISRSGYELEGWYTSALMQEAFRFNFNTPITSNLILYAKWVVISEVSHTWQRVYTSIYDTTIYPETSEYTCPTDYSSYLPDANGYQVGFVVNALVVRYCDPNAETCYENPITMLYFNVCEARQYEVIEVI